MRQPASIRSCVVADLHSQLRRHQAGTLLARDCCGETRGDRHRPGWRRRKAGSGRGRREAEAEAQSLPQLIDAEWVRSRIPPIRFDAHKGTRKHLAILGGGKGMPGASSARRKGALRSGIGLGANSRRSRKRLSDILACRSHPSLNAEWPKQAGNRSRHEISNVGQRSGAGTRAWEIS